MKLTLAGSMLIVNAVLFPPAVARAGPILDAIAARNPEQARELIAKGGDVNEEGDDGRTALMEAARHNDIDSVRALLKAGATVGAKDVVGRTALHHAVAWAQRIAAEPRLIAELIKAGADVNAKDSMGWTPLLEAARSADSMTLMMLVVMGADTAATTPDGWSALMIAAASNDLHWWRKWLVDEEMIRAKAAGQEARGDSDMAAGMVATTCDLACPSSKVWALLRHGKAKVDAADASGRRVDDLVAKRTDPEAAAIRSMLEIARRERVDRTVQNDPAFMASFPRPEGLPDRRSK